MTRELGWLTVTSILWETKFYINLKNDLIKFVPTVWTVYWQAEYSLAKVAGGIGELADGIGGINAENAGSYRNVKEFV